MHFTPAAVAALEVAHRNGIFSVSRLKAPNIRVNNTIDLTFRDGLSAPMRNSMISRTSPQYAVVVSTGDQDFKVCPFANPLVATNSAGEPIHLGNLTDTIQQVTAVSLRSPMVYGFFTTLVSKADADKFHLPTIPTAPDTVPAFQGPPDPDADDDDEIEPPNGMARLDFPHDPDDDNSLPVFVALPASCPLPPDFSIPEDHDLGTQIPGAEGTVFEVWRKGALYAVSKNSGNSVTLGGPLFDPAAIPDDAFAGLPLVPTLIHDVSMLPPISQQFRDVRAVAKEHQESALLTYGASVAPQEQAQPNQPAQPHAQVAQAQQPHGLAAVATALQQGFTQALQTDEDKDNSSRNKKASAKLRLAFGHTVPSLDPTVPATFQPATLTECGRDVLKAKKASTALIELHDQISLAEKEARKSPKTLDNLVTLRPDQLDLPFLAAIREFKFHMENFTTLVSVSPLERSLSILPFCTPKRQSLEFINRVSNGQLLQVQETVGEDSTKLTKKTTELYISGDITGTSLLNAIANFRCVFKVLIEDFDDSDFWAKTLYPLYILLKQEGELWMSDNKNNIPFAINLLGDIHLTMIPFFSAATNKELWQGVLDNRPIPPDVHRRGIASAVTIRNKIENSITTGTIDNYKSAPTYSIVLPQYRNLPIARQSGSQDRRQLPAQPSTFPPSRDRNPSAPSQNQPRGRQSPPSGRENSTNQRADRPPNPVALEKGFLEWNRSSPEPPVMTVRARVREGSTQQERLCLPFMCRGLACTRGRGCQFIHAQSLDKLHPSAQQKLKDWVAAAPGISFAPNAHQQGTPRS